MKHLQLIKSLFLLLLLACFVQAKSQIGSRQTTFKPEIHGLKFTNSLQIEVVNDIRMAGFCGGMVYTALDYYRSKKSRPKQDYKPANGTPLYSYIWERQVNSVSNNLDKWTELTVNPFGWRTIEFFNWGLQGFGGGRLEELKRMIDKGNPVPLGLFKPGNGGAGPHHQVLAIGYNGGRYKGDLGKFQEELEIMVYDPNYPGVTRTLMANPKELIYYYKEDPKNENCYWQTYFVNMKYQSKTPPTITAAPAAVAGMVSEILLEIRTGGDDLRGGTDNVNVSVRIKGQPEQWFTNINKSARWIGNYSETVSLRLATPVRQQDLESIFFSTKFGGGIGGDNWNMDMVRVMVNGAVITEKSGSPLNRFTAERKFYTLRIQ